MAKVKLRDSVALPRGPRRWRCYLEERLEATLDEEVGAMAIGRQRENEFKAFVIASVLAIVEALDEK